MSIRLFKATIEAISPSHSAGKRMVVFGQAFEGQVAKDRAIHIGLMKGLGASKVVSIHFYKNGDGYYNAQFGKGMMKDGMLTDKALKHMRS